MMGEDYAGQHKELPEIWVYGLFSCLCSLGLLKVPEVLQMFVAWIFWRAHIWIFGKSLVRWGEKNYR